MNEQLIERPSFTERINMSSPPTELLWNSRLAKQRLGEIFETTQDLGCDNQSPITGNDLVTIDQNELAKRQRPARDLTRSRDIFRDSARDRRPRSDRTKGDMTASSFALTLLLIATIAAVYTDRPAFWLLMGPFPLVAGFTMMACFNLTQRRKGAKAGRI
jgi:hypothetical protein